MRKKILVVLLSILVTGEIATAKGLTRRQVDNADRVADIAYEEWDRYGILPSVAVCQALNESSLGTKCDDYNWFGIKGATTGERLSYSTFTGGMYAYLRIFQQDRYRVVKITDHDTQVRQILKGGYCPEKDYYKHMVQLYNKYGLEKYNNKLFRRLRRKEVVRKKRQARIRHQRCVKQQCRLLNEWSNQRGKRLKGLRGQ